MAAGQCNSDAIAEEDAMCPTQLCSCQLPEGASARPAHFKSSPQQPVHRGGGPTQPAAS